MLWKNAATVKAPTAHCGARHVSGRCTTAARRHQAVTRPF